MPAVPSPELAPPAGATLAPYAPPAPTPRIDDALIASWRTAAFLALRATTWLAHPGDPHPPAGPRTLVLPVPGYGGGTVLCATRDHDAPWTDADLALARAFAEMAASAADVTRRVQETGQALRASEEHFRRLIEHAHDAVVIVDEEGRARYGSPAVARVLGYDPAALEGHSLEPLIHPDDLAGVWAWIRRLAREPGRMHRHAYRFRHADGGWVHLEAASAAAPDYRPGDGHVINIRDVSERVAAERALAASEERWRALIENAHDLIQLLDRDGRVAYTGPSVTRLLGYTPGELLGGTMHDFVHPDDIPALAPLLERVVAQPGTPQVMEYRVRHKDGAWRWLETWIRTFAPHTADLGIVGNARDVTERRAAKEALAASEARWRRMIENAHDALVLIDTEGRFTYLSPPTFGMFGYAPEELVGQDNLAFVHPDDRAALVAEIQRAAATPGTLGQAAFRFRHKDGSWRMLEANGRTLSSTSAAQGIVANVRDVTERHEAEQRLRESEARYRSLIEQLPAIVCTASLDDGFPTTFVSPQVERLLGWPEAEWYANPRRWIDSVHPDDRERVEAEWNAAHAAGRPFSAEYRMRTRDGRTLWFRDDAVLQRDPRGEPSHVQGVLLDITERKEAELALARSEERWRRLIEHGSDLLMVARADRLSITYVSPSAERLLGWTPEEMFGHTPETIVHPDDAPAVVETLGALAAEPGRIALLAGRLRHKDGTWRLFEAPTRALRHDDGTMEFVMNARDVTAQRAAERALAASEEHFRRLIEHGNDLLMIASGPDLALTYVSPSAGRLLGWSADEMIGRTPDDMLHPDDSCALRDELTLAVADPSRVARTTWRIRHKDGGWRLFEALGRAVPLDGAGAIGFIVNGRDITDRVTAEEALRQAKADAEQAREEAERANRAKSEFLSRMSHELRTPLNSILGFAQVLEEVELAPEYRTGVRHILNGGRHLLALINEVLDIARIEAGHQALSLEPVQVGAVIREAVDMIRPLAAARGVWVGALPHPVDDRWVRADRQRLAQVLLNLLSNAVKYNRDGGAVRIGAEPGDGRVAIRVRDEGPGIAPERQGELFVPFARLGAEHTGVEGTGLGLALSQRLARAMGGELRLERTGSDGSVFAVELEAARDPLRELPITRASGAFEPGRETDATILYVEDNLANLSLVETILLPRPTWRLVPALQGRLGLELARRHLPDVILLDLHLPDLPGREVLRLLRADPRTARTPVIVISADATPGTADALRADGADAFLTKPLDVRAFLATVDAALAARGTPA